MATAKITTLTPVHIGNGQKLLRDFDFIVENGKVGLLNLEKVVQVIGINRLPQLTAEIEKKKVKDYLKRTIPAISFNELCDRTIKTNEHISQTTGELKEQIYTSLQGPCIPGSSLKGSLRTLMLSYLTDDSRNNETQQREFLRNVNWNGKIQFDKLDRVLFGDTANVKSTRFLIVGDIQFKNGDTEIHELSYINQLGDESWEYETNKLQLVECIRAGASATFQLKLNLELAEIYRKKQERLVSFNPENRTMPSLKDLTFFDKDEATFLTNVNLRTRKLLQWDIKKLKDLEAEQDLIDALVKIQKIADTCKDGEAVVRVGGHNGWHFMTGRWMMYDKDVFTDEMFDAMQASAQRTNRYIGQQFPKTRKMTDAGLPLGFVKIALK
ncbi:MAG: type III-A CRISPR-associated RAMP protein Csm5 [Bacteroidetes bacterium]|nr:type III-A CRISPR-associated RAMP protein Csm5 [Bacteroidota bacterium]